MGQKCACKLLILNGNLESAGFEWLPCLEGIKTAHEERLPHKMLFEWLPCLEGIKTHLLEPFIRDICLNGFPV